MSDDSKVYDVIIVGGGPAGLSAALYTARERLTTLVLDKGDFGGMAAVTETIDNYPGFRSGVGGRALIDEMVGQVERFGAVCENFTEVTDVHQDGKELLVHAQENKQYKTKSVLITTGSTYRKLHIPGEEELIGRGIHFCATCDAPLYKDKQVVVIGGGNSALQESLFIARFAKQLDMLVQGDTLTGSTVLQEEIATKKNITVHYNVDNQSIEKSESRGQISIHVRQAQSSRIFKTDGIFVFIGLLPNSHGFDTCGLDAHGFIESNQQFQTKMSGVFVAGDVRSGSTWQIGAAVGEGISAALAMREYVDVTFPNWHVR